MWSKSRVPNQNGVSLLYIMLEIHHSGRKPSKYCDKTGKSKFLLISTHTVPRHIHTNKGTHFQLSNFHFIRICTGRHKNTLNKHQEVGGVKRVDTHTVRE